MRRATRLALLGIVGLAHPACSTWIDTGFHTLEIQAPAKIARGEELYFFVQTKDAQGRLVYGAHYHWTVDWVGVRGLVHKGRTATRESIRVKGAAGQAVLHVLGFDARGEYGEVARRVFEVE